jgi:hypothetical protein
MSKYKWKNQFKTIDSASKFHQLVQEVFISDSYFRQLNCYQEVNLKDLVPGYSHHNHHFDWYIEELNTILEVHGRQHYSVVNYGNLAYDIAIENHQQIKNRDRIKMDAALEAGYEYRIVSYKDKKKISPDFLKELIFYG